VRRGCACRARRARPSCCVQLRSSHAAHKAAQSGPGVGLLRPAWSASTPAVHRRAGALCTGLHASAARTPPSSATHSTTGTRRPCTGHHARPPVPIGRGRACCGCGRRTHSAATERPSAAASAASPAAVREGGREGGRGVQKDSDREAWPLGRLLRAAPKCPAGAPPHSYHHQSIATIIRG